MLEVVFGGTQPPGLLPAPAMVRDDEGAQSTQKQGATRLISRHRSEGQGGQNPLVFAAP